MKHRCSGALHLLADNTSLIMEYYTEERGEWHEGSFYVIDKADRDLLIDIRIRDERGILWSTVNNGR